MPNLIENLVDADHNYLKHLNGDIIIGIVQVYDYLPIPDRIYDGTLKFIDLALKRLNDKTESAWEEAKEAAHNPLAKECYSSEFAKMIGDFIAKSEFGFFTGLTENTWLGEQISIPPDSAQIAAEMQDIPLCR